MTPTERIRRALERTEAARNSQHTSTIQPVSELRIKQTTAPVEKPAVANHNRRSGLFAYCLAATGMFGLGMFCAHLMQHGSSEPLVVKTAAASIAAYRVEPPLQQRAPQKEPVVRTPAAEPPVFLAERTAPTAADPQARPARRFIPPSTVRQPGPSAPSPDLLETGSAATVISHPLNAPAALAVLSAVQSRPAAPPQTPRIGGDLRPAQLLKSVPPTYPPLAKTARIEGTVRFKAIIGKDGAVDRVELLSGPQILVQAAREAVLQWVYRPAMLDGAPAETATQIEVRFTLSR